VSTSSPFLTKTKHQKQKRINFEGKLKEFLEIKTGDKRKQQKEAKSERG
jgi:hypothetical protein